MAVVAKSTWDRNEDRLFLLYRPFEAPDLSHAIPMNQLDHELKFWII